MDHNEYKFKMMKYFVNVPLNSSITKKGVKSHRQTK